MMINGAGAAVEQYFTGSGIYGRLILTALSVIAIVFGLSKMVEIIGAAGYGMIACMLIIALISIMKSNGVSEKAITVSGQMISLKGAGTWYLSAMKYAGNSILTLIPVWILCGKKAESKTTAETSPIFGSVAWFGTALLIVFAQFSAIDKVAGLQIPNLRLAQIYAPSFSVLFLFVLVLAAFSAITSELWYLIDVISHKTGFSYKATVVICGSALFIISGLFSFNVVVHWLYTFCFYIGLIVLGMLLLT